jgi:hypothetical protein
MMVEGCNSKRHTCRVPLTVVVMVLGVILSGRSALLAAQPNLAAQPSAAAQATSDAQSSAAAKPTPVARVKRRLIPVTINKGQNYTISGVKDAPAPGIKVVNNPNALVLQIAPGRIEMVGADAGTWRIKTTLATGEKVTYVVTVKALAPPQGTLVPASAPTPIP